MKRLLLCILVGWVTAAALFGCRASRPAAHEPLSPVSPLAQATPAPPDSTAPARVTVQPPRSLLDKVLGRTPAPVTYAGTAPITAGKKSTITYYAGPATVSTTTVGKKGGGAAGPAATATTLSRPKGPANVGAGDLTNQAGATNAAAAKGDGNQFDQKAEPPAPKLTLLQRITRTARAVLPWLAGAAGVWLLASGAAAVGVTLPGWLLPLLWRRKKSTT